MLPCAVDDEALVPRIRLSRGVNISRVRKMYRCTMLVSGGVRDGHCFLKIALAQSFSIVEERLFSISDIEDHAPHNIAWVVGFKRVPFRRTVRAALLKPESMSWQLCHANELGGWDGTAQSSGAHIRPVCEVPHSLI